MIISERILCLLLEGRVVLCIQQSNHLTWTVSEQPNDPVIFFRNTFESLELIGYVGLGGTRALPPPMLLSCDGDMPGTKTSRLTIRSAADLNS